MATIPVQFTYLTGVKKEVFPNARLTGSWDEDGRYSDQWTSTSMKPAIGEDGCPCFKVTVEFDDAQVGWQFRWGVILEDQAGNTPWGITTEINDQNSTECYLTFKLEDPNEIQLQEEKYYLTHCRRLGAQKYYPPSQSNPAIQFSVWAPNAEKVDVVFGGSSGYIADDGSGIDSSIGAFPMLPDGQGTWRTDVKKSPDLANFSKFDHKPYMYRIVKEGGQVAYRTDLYSRCQMGKGNVNPNGQPYIGQSTDLAGTKSCSVVIDLDTVSKNFKEDVWPEQQFVPKEEFWKDEFTPGRPVPTRLEDLVIYELHIGSLGYGKDRPGTFEDAIELLDKYLIDLGVNAIELLPISEFRDKQNWGYETSHYFALEYSAGGRDQLKHFIRECHRRGIAVILDVVYNHYDPDGERAEWAYDSNAPERNIYYWYEGLPTHYFYTDGRAFPEGGYVDNMSTGFAPRFHEEMVRKMFISSAVALIEDFHVDGFRVDQTTSMHLYNVLHANGSPLGNVNAFGAKFLREWTRTLKLIHPSVMLTAEDHSDWDKVTESPNVGGLGFDATWYSNFYHHLVGDARQGQEYAKLIPSAGQGGDGPLAMDYFAGVLGWSGHQKVVYHESHDEAGNSSYEEGGNKIYSRRTIVAAVNSAPLIDETRHFAEARCHFAAGMTLLSAGTPMFLMGEEIGAQKPFKYEDFIHNREDLLGERQNNGQRMFKFYQDLLQFRRNHSGLRTREIDIIHVHNANRIIAFKRWDASEELLIVASLNNHSFEAGYTIENSRLGEGNWKEVFNSDSNIYGGYNVGNFGVNIPSNNGRIHVVIPANGFVVFQKA